MVSLHVCMHQKASVSWTQGNRQLKGSNTLMRTKSICAVKDTSISLIHTHGLTSRSLGLCRGSIAASLVLNACNSHFLKEMLKQIVAIMFCILILHMQRGVAHKTPDSRLDRLRQVGTRRACV